MAKNECIYVVVDLHALQSRMCGIYKNGKFIHVRTAQPIILEHSYVSKFVIAWHSWTKKVQVICICVHETSFYCYSKYGNLQQCIVQWKNSHMDLQNLYLSSTPKTVPLANVHVI